MRRIGYFIILLFLYPLAYLPKCCLSAIGRFLFFIICYLLSYRKKVIVSNLKNAFPQKSEKDIRHYAKAFYKSFSDVLVEYLILWRIPASKTKKYLKIKNPEVFEKYKDRPIIFVIGHFNNWEWYSLLPFFTNHNVLGVVKPIRSINFGKLITKIRSLHGMDVILKRNTLREILKRVNANIPSLSIFAGDQTPTANEINFWTTFLNQETPIYLGAEKIAKKINGVVIYAEMLRVKRHYYEVNLQLITDNPQKEPDYHITLKHVAALEKTILKQPESWLWSHRRWKHKRKPNEKVWERLPL